MKLEAIIAYFCKYYPYTTELSNSRLTKLVYLADWFSCLLKNKQMTNIIWMFNHYGPYVEDVLKAVENSSILEVHMDFNYYGSPKYLIKLIDSNQCFFENNLDKDDKQVLEFVISKTKSMYYNDFIDYVYSTYPIVTSQRYDVLNLAELSRAYNQRLN